MSRGRNGRWTKVRNDLSPVYAYGTEALGARWAKVRNNLSPIDACGAEAQGALGGLTVRNDLRYRYEVECYWAPSGWRSVEIWGSVVEP